MFTHLIYLLAMFSLCKASPKAKETVAQDVCAADKQGSCPGDSKAITAIMPAPRAHWVGDAFHVYPVFSNLAFTEQLSPFLMFDYAAPKKFEPTSKQRGVGKHPHRGFETVTIAFQGEVEHADSVGNRGVIGPGDVQWMTAARGIVHEEYHSRELAKQGGVLEMCQLWVNLPKKYKMEAPAYQPILNKDIPVVPLTADDEEMVHGSVRVIAGKHMDVQGAAKTFTPMNVWDISMKTSGRGVDLEVPAGHTTLVFVRRGKLKVGSDGVVGPQGMVRLDPAGSRMRLEALEKDTQLLLLGGKPIGEPIANAGPFVMNTQAELDQANSDFRSGKMGR